MPTSPLISVANLTPTMADHYVVSALSKIWRDRDLRVECGVGYEPDANVCILHHDLTCLDASLLPRAPDSTAVLNGQVLDISKKSYSVLRVTEATIWDGPVIVKSNLNHFGFPETGQKERPSRMRALLHKLRTRLSQTSWRAARMLPAGIYPVLDTKDDVPGWVWRDPDLIVEKFLPERTDDGMYSIRGWMFLGNKGYAYRNIATDPLVKAATTVRHEFFSDAPPALYEYRKRMGFDFGKFDYVEHGDDVYLLDANKTPSFPIAKPEPSPRVLELAKGIEEFL